MIDKPNFKIERWKKGRIIENKINRLFGKNLIWHNANFNEFSNVQQDGNGPADFTIKGTQIHLEIQVQDFGRDKIRIYKRKFFNYFRDTATNNYVYTSAKDMAGIFIVASDGGQFLIESAEKLELNWVKGEFEEEYVDLSFDKFKRLDIFGFAAKIRKAQEMGTINEKC